MSEEIDSYKKTLGFLNKRLEKWSKKEFIQQISDDQLHNLIFLRSDVRSTVISLEGLIKLLDE